jgi:GT2 family glycosyltransferase
VRQHSFTAEEARGAGWARLIAYGMSEKEDYILIIDAHMRFEKGWDDMLVNALHACPSSKAVLTAMLPNYKAGEAFYLEEDDMMFLIAATHLAEETSPQIVHLGGGKHAVKDITAPRPAGALVFNFIFARAEAFDEVPIDPHIYFYGEELAYSARLWTHGYDFFQPNMRVAYHHWKPSGSHKSIQDPRNLRTRQRVRHLLKLEDAQDVSVLLEMDRYRLGNARKLEDYWEYLGVDPVARTLSQKAYFGKWA